MRCVPASEKQHAYFWRYGKPEILIKLARRTSVQPAGARVRGRCTLLFPSVAQINLAKLNALQLLSGRRLSNKITQNQAGSSLRYPPHSPSSREGGVATINPSCLSGVVGRVSEQPTLPLCGLTTVQACTATHLVAINQLERRGGAESEHTVHGE